MATYRALGVPVIVVSLAVVGCSHSSPATITSPHLAPSHSGSTIAPESKSAGPPSPAASLNPASSNPASSTSQGSGGTSTQSAIPTEKSPPGDIPDNLAFVPYANAAGHYRFSHPEGWAETVQNAKVLFTDKLNGVMVEPGAATSPPNVSSATAQDASRLRATQPAFELKSVKAVTEIAGSGVLIVYRRNSAPDEVTGRQYRDEVVRYELVSRGREVVLEIYGPVGADNVDAYRSMVTSLRIG